MMAIAATDVSQARMSSTVLTSHSSSQNEDIFVSIVFDAQKV
jgi:hypothetical protein